MTDPAEVLAAATEAQTAAIEARAAATEAKAAAYDALTAAFQPSNGPSSRTKSSKHPFVAAYWYWWLAIIACALVRFVELSSTTHRALALAVLLLGALIIVQFLIELIWGALGEGNAAQSREKRAETYKQGFQQAAATLIGVPGLVLGLLAVFGNPPFPIALKVGAASLVVSLIASLILLFLTSLDVSPDKGPLVFLGSLVNLIFWSLAFGVLCITAVLILANGAIGGSG